jgi:hypothetical protein
MATLTTTEILADVIKAFRFRLPMLPRMGLDLRPSTLKKDKTYTAHVSAVPNTAAFDDTTGYANGAVAADTLLTDVNIKTANLRHVPIKFTHIGLMSQDKRKYQEVVRNAGYALAKYFIDDILAKVGVRSFSQESVYAEADCDYDMLSNVQGDMNLVGAADGRTMLVNTPVAGTMGADARLISRDYKGQMPDGVSYRIWRDIAGFGEIMEYPGLSTNNGTALTGVSGANAGDLFTKEAHGLITGDPVIITFGSGFTGLTSGTKYYVIRASADTFQLATTAANAIAGTAQAISADGTDAVVTKTENLVAFGFDPRAIAVLMGFPEDTTAMARELGIPQVMKFEPLVDEEMGLPIMGVTWQQPGTGDLYFSPALLWGSRLGREADPATPNTTLAAGSLLDNAGHRVIKA